MNQRDAKSLGRERGHNVASWVDMPDMGSTVRTDADGKQIVGEDNVWDIMESLAYQNESANRDFSPFEHTAHAFNEAKNSDALWEAFEAGITLGIQSNLSQRRKALTKGGR